MRKADRSNDVFSLPRDLGHANGRPARRVETTAPAAPLGQITRLRIAELHDKTRHAAVNAEAVVEARPRQLNHVGHGAGRICGEGLHGKNTALGLHHQDGCLPLLRGPGRSCGHDERAERHADEAGSDHAVARRRVEAVVTPIRGHRARIWHAGHRGYTGRQTFCPHVTKYKLMYGHQRSRATR